MNVAEENKWKGSEEVHEVSLSDDESHSSPSPSPQRASLEAALTDDTDEVALSGNVEVGKLVLEKSSMPPTNSQMDSSAAEEEMTGEMRVRVEKFERRGEGMNAYIVYLVVTHIRGVPAYNRETFEVWRRFSDFLGLHEKLADKLQGRGVILPQPPEKNIAVLSKSKSSDGMVEQASLRKRLLERPDREWWDPRFVRIKTRYMNRLVSHPSLRIDCDLRDFITLQIELPKATNTATLSSGGMKRILKSVGEAFTKMAVHMEEGDRWFEHMQSHTDEQEDAIRRMHSISETLVQTRRDLANVGDTFSKALSLLASCEESTALARCLSHLTELEENSSTLWNKQADADTAILAETLGEYVSLFNSLRNAFCERHRVWHNWQTAQQNITKKREQKTRLELSGKTDRLNSLKAETEEAVQKADELEATFARISEEIKKEVARFDATRKRDIKAVLVRFLESLLATQEEMLKVWQRFAPETAVIIT